MTHTSLSFTVTQILVALNKNSESDIGVNAEDQGSKGPSLRVLMLRKEGDPVLHYRMHLSPPSLRLQ